MKNKHSEIGLMTVILLFVVFAFLMQGRAHGDGLYRVDIIKDAFCYADMNLRRNVCRDEYMIENMRFTNKETAYDLAFALNRAHEERTRPTRKLTEIDWNVMRRGPCVECDLDTSTCRNIPCTEEKPR